jgi:hypothetical protein
VRDDQGVREDASVILELKAGRRAGARSRSTSCTVDARPVLVDNRSL